MTKPIEGWVSWNYEIENRAKDNPIFTNSIFGLTVVDTKEALGVPDPHAPGWVPRPVLVTFTDEHVINEKADLGMAFVAGAAWRKDDEVAEAIRKERERIFKEWVDRTELYCEDDEGRFVDWPMDKDEVRTIIFGEEK